jgi:hypothetical protein
VIALGVAVLRHPLRQAAAARPPSTRAHRALATLALGLA